MEAIKILREKAGLTQHQLGQMLKVGQSAVAMWEAGESSPRADKLPELARILGCTIDELYGQPADKPPAPPTQAADSDDNLIDLEALLLYGDGGR